MDWQDGLSRILRIEQDFEDWMDWQDGLSRILRIGWMGGMNFVGF